MSLAERWKKTVGGPTYRPLRLLARAGLRCASVPYGLVTRLRNSLYDAGIYSAARAGVPVISVGNLTLGGTGKTPCVEWLALYFRQRDVAVAILSRGYGADAGPNDEAQLLEENLPDVPHLQGRDRAALARTAVEELESEVLILDDGFQHRRLFRDVNLVLFDATQQAIHIFPRGLLRESLGGLRRADLLILTHADRISLVKLYALKKRLLAYRPGLPVAFAHHKALFWCRQNLPGGPAKLFENRQCLAFCGLAKPESFRQTLEDLQVKVLDFRAFPDHHNYTQADIAELRKWAAGFLIGTPMLTTQKDFVKLRTEEIGGCPLYYLRIGLEITEGREELEKLLAPTLHREPEVEEGDGQRRPGGGTPDAFHE